MTDLLQALAAYVRVLDEASERTRHAEDRPRYTSHLAEAARMFAAATDETDPEALPALVASERRAYGWSYLSGEEGERVECAFNTLATLVELR